MFFSSFKNDRFFLWRTALEDIMNSFLYFPFKIILVSFFVHVFFSKKDNYLSFFFSGAFFSFSKEKKVRGTGFEPAYSYETGS